MPAQSGGNLKGKLKGVLGGAVKKHRTDDTVVPGGGDLPPGIDNGIAQLVEAKIDEHKDGNQKGKLFAFFSGVVVSVGESDPKGVIGRRASKIIGLYPSQDGKKTTEDRVAELLNEMRLLGVDTSNLSEDDIEDALAALKAEAPYFAFRTWRGNATPAFPNPRTNTTFSGKVDHDEDGAGAEGGTVEDSSGAGEQAGDAGEGSSTEGGEGDEPDWTALGEAADGGDTEAAAKIESTGNELGIGEAVGGAENWLAGAMLIQEHLAGGEGGAEAPWVPSVGETYKIKPAGAKKAVDVEITAVFESKSTLNYKGADGKPVKGVKYDSDAKTIAGQKV